MAWFIRQCRGMQRGPKVMGSHLPVPGARIHLQRASRPASGLLEATLKVKGVHLILFSKVRQKSPV